MATQLTHLAEVERLSPACIRILGGNPGKFTLQGTNTYLVGTGPKRLLIDTGEGRASWIAALKRTLDEERASITAAIITHWHGDHTGGIPDLIAAWPSAKVYKHSPDAGQLDLPDGQTFHVDGASLTALHTPGHTTDHTVLLFAEEDAMFTGDNVLGHGTAVFEDLTAYMDSLERMRKLFRGRAYPGHGAAVPDGPTKIAEYIRHRQQREEQVVQMLRSDKKEALETAVEGGGGVDGNDDGSGNGNSWTVMELVKSIYRDVPESLHPAAAAGVIQILQKLEREGRATVSEEGGRWRLMSSARSAL
ncbi:Beta-lactamase-like protein 2 [Madurella mycetomatis]|uniref:Beta-lactamase-like protein 2 n=1 Tax=Madurella mycetomatis TaxID=100816 RepID=A0A175W4B0_9PEZI|nr:Beta-lactamase-like protein 2 [Madurella mycetomatis]